MSMNIRSDVRLELGRERIAGMLQHAELARLRRALDVENAVDRPPPPAESLPFKRRNPQALPEEVR